MPLDKFFNKGYAMPVKLGKYSVMDLGTILNKGVGPLIENYMAQ